ncbi:MAG TPA: phosphate ABC transporter ATP-binding protein [Vicinamibacterales bacterium]|jgi:tungstate transport system ATP-binding protein
MSPNIVYRLDSIRHRYGDRVVLDIGEFEIRRGETLAIIGPSGAGKSTLLRLLQFLECPTDGALRFHGEAVAPSAPLELRRRVTTVFQRPIVLDRSVRANIAYGIRLRGRDDHQARVAQLLDALGLTPLADEPARTLSGGEVQRVALGRALAFSPEILLLDEPTANLDPRNVRLVEDLVREQQARGVTIVLATHQIFQARRLTTRAALLLDGQIVESGPTADLIDHPADPRTKAFLTGDMIY